MKYPSPLQRDQLWDSKTAQSCLLRVATAHHYICLMKLSQQHQPSTAKDRIAHSATEDPRQTNLMIEHTPTSFPEVADRLFFLHQGKIDVFENMETLRKDQHVMKAYIW
ncbi:MAG: hypothetical protein IPN95_27980 [Bacteroidetes bacterium]|nr:hypothetical protein [Bacteroidota bacterium]